MGHRWFFIGVTMFSVGLVAWFLTGPQMQGKKAFLEIVGWDAIEDTPARYTRLLSLLFTWMVLMFTGFLVMLVVIIRDFPKITLNKIIGQLKSLFGFSKRYKTLMRGGGLWSRTFRYVVLLTPFFLVFILLITEWPTPGRQEFPFIHGAIIVWQEYIDGNWDICTYNVETGEEKRVISGPGNQLQPQIHGNMLVWINESNGSRGSWYAEYADDRFGHNYTDIYTHDLATGEQKQITSTNKADDVYPTIFGNIIVWSSGGNAAWDGSFLDLFTYNLGTGEETLLTPYPEAQVLPVIYENIIVWQDYRNLDLNIHMYNLETGEEKQITYSKWDQCNPAIYENIIVWQDYRNRDWFIYMYNLETDIEERVMGGIRPSIHGDIIVCEQVKKGKRDIFAYNLTSKRVTEITKRGRESYPKVFGNIIVWHSKTGKKNSDIYMHNLKTGETTRVA